MIRCAGLVLRLLGSVALATSVGLAGCVRNFSHSPGVATDTGADRTAIDQRSGSDRAVIDRAARDGGNVPGSWVAIPAGTFLMGSLTDEPCRVGSHEAQHQVTLTRSFEMQTTEVTEEEFLAVMKRNPSALGCGPTCPVQNLSWHEAAAYCNRLSENKGLQVCYSCTGTAKDVQCAEASGFSGKSPSIHACPGFRLPTEAEWEYAYRAGTTTALYSGVNAEPPGGMTCAYDQCWGDANADPIAWYCDTPPKNTHPVKTKQPNGWGLYDMAGNVFEWCHDWFQADINSPAIDPVVTEPDPASPGRAVRGGNYVLHPGFLRAACRWSEPPENRYPSGGFRCVRTR